jgi:hypothetical protein
MTTQERKYLAKYDMARAAYDRAPSYTAAQAVALVASQLTAISDDYQELADEADDLISTELDGAVGA